MFIGDAEKRLRVGARLRRVLVVDPNVRSSRYLASMLKAGVQSRVLVSAYLDAGYSMAQAANPQLIFVEHPSSGVDGYSFCRAIRRSDPQCRKCAIIMVTAEATASAISMARDAGVHEFLRKPYTTGELQRRLEAVALHERGWIEGINYVGPDRRRFGLADYKGPRRRARDQIERAGAGANEERLLQALRILRAAEAASFADLAQVKRAIAVQTSEIRTNPSSPTELAELSAELGRWCSSIDRFDASSRTELDDRIRTMVRFLPGDDLN